MNSTIVSIGYGFLSKAPCDCSRFIVRSREASGNGRPLSWAPSAVTDAGNNDDTALTALAAPPGRTPTPYSVGVVCIAPRLRWDTDAFRDRPSDSVPESGDAADIDSAGAPPALSGGYGEWPRSGRSAGACCGSGTVHGGEPWLADYRPRDGVLSSGSSAVAIPLAD